MRLGTKGELKVSIEGGSGDAAVNRKPIIAVDFDGVLHSYTSGWQGPHVASDPPVEGAYEFLREAVMFFSVAIYSSRSVDAGGRYCMEEYCRKWFPDVWPMLWFPMCKPPAFLSLDDRAVCFVGTFPRPGDLLDFKPWNKR